MKSVLVTGASGFLGKNLVAALLEQNYKIIAIDTRFEDSIFENDNITCLDISKYEISELHNHIPKQEYDCLFQLAWIATSGPGRSDYEVQLNNVKMTCDYIRLCDSINCKRIVYASSINEMETYEYLQSDNISPSGGYIYGAGKLAAHLMGETVAKMSGVEFIPVIITNIFGVGEKSARLIYTSIKKMLNNEHCSFTEGYQIYDFIYITDAINSIVAVSQNGIPFCRYYIGSGEPKPLREFLLELRDIVDPSIEIGLGDIPFMGAMLSYDQFDLKRVERDTGYKNQISFSEGIQMTLDYIRSEENL